MPPSSTSINDLTPDSLAHIFAFLPPDERVRLERVCRQWQKIAKKYAWTEFRTLMMDRNELAKKGRPLALTKCRALLDRCGPHLRELSIPALRDYGVQVDQWPMLRNLRHLRFDGCCVGSETLRAVADNLTQLRSIRFSDIDWRCISVLHELLRIDNASLQALRLPLSDYRGDPLRLPALPSSLRSLHICEGYFAWLGERKRIRIDELLELAASCCPQLAMLMLPMDCAVSELSLTKIGKFKKLSYLRFSFILSNANVFEDLLTKIGTQLKALLLGIANPKVLHLIAKHCPMLEHCYFGITGAGLLSALQSVFRLAHLRSVSIRNYGSSKLIYTQILTAVNGLNAKGNLEYLNLSWGLSLSVEFIANLIQHNPKLRKLSCAILFSLQQEPAAVDKLDKLLQNMEGPLELELGHCPRELEKAKNSRIRVRDRWKGGESISQPMLRQFWAQAMGSLSVPDLSNLDD